MKIQFIVCTYNNEGIIEDCLQSILSQRIREGIKIRMLVVDDNSKDSTLDKVRKYNIPFIKKPRTTGPAISRNIGYKLKSADYYFFLDSDVVLDESCLANMLSMISEPGIYGPKLLLPDGRINSAGGGLSKTGIGYDIGYKKPDKGFDKVEDVMYICSAAMLADAQVLRKIGLFDETYGYGHEDTDIGWRANLARFPVQVIPSATAMHMKSQTVSKNKDRIYYDATKNRLRSIIKNYNTKNMIKYGSWYILLSFGDIIFRSYKINKLKAWGWTIKNIHNTLKERKKVQALRLTADAELPFGGLLPK